MQQTNFYDAFLFQSQVVECRNDLKASLDEQKERTDFLISKVESISGKLGVMDLPPNNKTITDKQVLILFCWI